ncbi:MAG: GYF domain-containing protein, partial [Planctomycetota bacterium]
GPVTEDELRGMIHRGELTADQLVWRGGMEDWRAAGSVQVLETSFRTRNQGAAPSAVSFDDGPTLQYRTAPAAMPGYDPNAGQATGAMVCGIIGLLFAFPGFCCPPVSAATLVLGLIALVLGYNARSSQTRAVQALAGIVLGWISLALCVLGCGFFFAFGFLDSM